MILADPDEPGTGQRIYPAVADIERQHFIVVEHDTGDRRAHARERGRRRDRAIEARISRIERGGDLVSIGEPKPPRRQRLDRQRARHLSRRVPAHAIGDPGPAPLNTADTTVGAEGYRTYK